MLRVKPNDIMLNLQVKEGSLVYFCPDWIWQASVGLSLQMGTGGPSCVEKFSMVTGNQGDPGSDGKEDSHINSFI